jgi:hypothetical protein
MSPGATRTCPGRIDGSKLARTLVETPMNRLLWLLQGSLALSFLFLGSLKLRHSKEIIAGDTVFMGRADRLSTSHIKLIGFAQIVGALGLVEPWSVGYAKVLTPIAATCLAGLMFGGVALQARRKEPFILPLVLGVLVAIVAVGRFAALAR